MIGQPVRMFLATDNGLNEGAARRAKDTGGDGIQLGASIFEDLVSGCGHDCALPLT